MTNAIERALEVTLLMTTLLFTVNVGCGSTPVEPPVLPGELPPPCELSFQRTFLIRDMAIPDFQEYPIDLSIPTDSERDTQNYPYQYFKEWGPKLPDSIRRAFQMEHILWLVTLEKCAPSETFARVRVERGTTLVVNPRGPDSVEVAGDHVVWAVGEQAAGTGEFHVGTGIGVAPVALASDVQADSVEPEWFAAYNVTMDARTTTAPDGTMELSGSMALASEYSSALPAISEAMARTLNTAKADNPECTGDTCAYPWMSAFFVGFDTNGDGVFTGGEIIASGSLQVFNVIPTVDLLAPNPMGPLAYWPDHDRRAESIGSSWKFVAREVTRL